MGTTAHVVVTGGSSVALEGARRRIEELEARWSRFQPASELCWLNAVAGDLTRLSADTYQLVDRAVAAWSLTGGAFDPTVLPALRAAGYDRDFRQLRAQGPSAGVARGATVVDHATPSPGCSMIELFPELQAVRMPAGVELDAGGIGKGLAADLVTAELIEAGVAGAMVNLGGDLRVRGEPPTGDTWSLAVEHPLHPSTDLLRLALTDGAVATSSRLRRRWLQGDRARHHLVDPRTGAPVETAVVSVTAVASEGWWAEAATKVPFLGGTDEPWPAGALLAVVTEDGTIVQSPELEVLPG